MQGIVTNVAPFGAFVDVGAARNAKILIEPRLWKQFHVGDRIDECVVKEVELEKHRFCVTLQNAEAAIAENRVPLQELREGDLVEGVVDHKNAYGIWVNVGAEVIGRLNIPRRYTDQLSAGQYLPDIVVERIDLERKKLGLTMEHPEVIVDSAPITVADLLRQEGSRPPPPTAPPARPAPTAPTAPAQVAAPAPAAVLPAPRAPGPPPKSQEAGLRVGEFVDGVVVDVSAKVIMVDIGLGHLAALAVPAALRAQFRPEDEIQGMRVERVDWDEERQKGAVVLSLDEPELAIDEAETSFNSDKTSWERRSEPGDVPSLRGSWYDWQWSDRWDWRQGRWGDWYQGNSWWHRPYWGS
ncbi:unnamed protein product [Symbiodinium natans]|uniref:S1 motif domain-containing protein n=1 Tax=Symbiodinium natans TaxID=878477 RepID=A0A812U866_9DINO|nr:unnamed protein product [Symbiodinium natans]